MYWRFLLNVARSSMYVVYIPWQWANPVNLQFLDTTIWSRLSFAKAIQEGGWNHLPASTGNPILSFAITVYSSLLVPVANFQLSFFVKAYQSARGSLCCGRSFWNDLWGDSCVLRGSLSTSQVKQNIFLFSLWWSGK